jgi:peptidoglycan hydrolase-like amidase
MPTVIVEPVVKDDVEIYGEYVGRIRAQQFVEVRARVEDYLTSVISSEMNATSSLEFLKAHAVISRSWLLAQIEKRKALSKQGSNFFPFLKTETEYIRWYDREDHTIFDVCADDHCQRYQGITRASNQSVVEAVKETRGQVLMHKHAICDARFSKCCGGVTEEFNYCWEDKHYPYLSAVRDLDTDAPLPDLTQEEEAERWIRQRPESFCHTTDPKILSQILNNYDQETHDFYRWKVRYTQAELAELIAAKALQLYGQRWGIETSFRDIKDYKFGMGMGDVHISNPVRRDRLFLFSALAIVLLTLLGKAGDSVGLERTIKVNTSKSRTYSFFRQGVIYYQLLPKMKEANAVLLMDKFIYYLKQHRLYTRTLGII